MTQIRLNQTAPQAPGAPAPQAPAAPRPAAAAAPRRDTAETGLNRLLAQAGPIYQRLQRSVAEGDGEGARQALAELEPVLDVGRRLTENTPHAAAFARVEAAAGQVASQLETRPVMVGLPGRGGRMVEVKAPAAPARTGKLAVLGTAAEGAGKALDAVGKVAFFPLELAGKVIDPISEKTGALLDGLKQGIDGTVGRVPVIGSVARFATGFAASVVGLVGCALQAVTHPRELVKGLATMAWTVVGLVPGPRTAWDMAVNGQGAGESLKGAWGEAGTIVMAIFEYPIEDAKAGNWAGALGRLTADIGAFFVTSGAANGGRAAVAGARVGRFARFMEASRLNRVIGAGGRVLAGANDLSAAVLRTGFKGNFAVWRGAGRLATKVPGAQRLMGALDGPAAKAKPRATATPAAVMERTKIAGEFAPEALGGEIRAKNVRSLEEAVISQGEVLGQLDGPTIYESIYDVAIEGFLEQGERLQEAFKGLTLDGKPVKSFEQAAEAWKALPPNAPQRAEIGRRLAAHIQQSMGDGLKFQPSPMQFTALPENLAGMEAKGKVLIDPALLNEDLGYLVNVMAEEQTHAYQRFLVEHQDDLAMPKRVKAEVEKYTRDFAKETYLNPPPRSLSEFADGLGQLNEGLKRLADHGDETDFLAVRRKSVADMAPGTAERAVSDHWWKAVGDESQRLSHLKYADQALAQAQAKGSTRVWYMDYAERLPREILEHNGVRRAPEEVRFALQRAIKESQEALRGANQHAESIFKDWDQAYRGQTLEFTAKSVAKDIQAWLQSQDWTW